MPHTHLPHGGLAPGNPFHYVITGEGAIYRKHKELSRDSGVGECGVMHTNASGPCSLVLGLRVNILMIPKLRGIVADLLSSWGDGSGDGAGATVKDAGAGAIIPCCIQAIIVAVMIVEVHLYSMCHF